MPPSAGTLRVGRYFAALLALFIVLYTVVFWPGQRHTPKLGLDLEGGSEVILQAQANGKTPTSSSMNTAREIIENRVNGLGVSSAQVVIQGKDRIVVSVPGKDSSAVEKVGQAALLQFRPEILAAISSAPATATTTPSASASATTTAGTTAKATASPAKATASPKTSSATGAAATTTPAATATSSASTTTSTSPSPEGRAVPLAAGSTPVTPTSATTSASSTAKATAGASTTPSATPTATSSAGRFRPSSINGKRWDLLPPKDLTAYNALTAAQQTAVQNVYAAWDCNNANIKPLDEINEPIIACGDPTGQSTAGQKFLLGAVIVQGKEISSASAIAPSAGGSLAWSINLSLKSTGQQQWATYTSQHNTSGVASTDTPPADDTVAYTLDSVVTQAATIQSTITGDTSITGTFSQKEATDFANALKYGALPLSFTTLENTSVSATLGSSQLQAGLLAGGIGLILVVLYSLLYYRALGLVTIASLVVSGGLTYAMLVILGKQIGLTLSLAGIAGFIVAVGITADSFVVFFERIKDEVHEGRSSRVAIPRAWDRARRTILSADFVSFLAAVILYYFAAGDVKGFAFTLGLSTVLDLVVVFLFTHPIVSLFSRSAAFGSARFTGLDHVRVGGVPSYRSAERGRRGTGSSRTSSTMVAEPEVQLPLEEDVDVTADDQTVEPEVLVEPPPRPQKRTPKPTRSTARPTQTEEAEPASGSSSGPSQPATVVGAGSTPQERAAARRAAQRANGKPNTEEKS